MLRVCDEGDKVRGVTLDGVVVAIYDEDGRAVVFDAVVAVVSGVGSRLSRGMTRWL